MAHHRLMGFSLIELLVVMAMVGLLFYAVTPSFSKLMEKHEKDSLVLDLYSTLALAQSEATKRRLPVNIKPIDKLAWQKGWTTHVDKDRNALPSSSADILNQHAITELNSKIVLKSSDVVESITFLPDGSAELEPKNSTVRFYTCQKGDTSAKQSLRLTRSGNFKIDNHNELSCGNN